MLNGRSGWLWEVTLFKKNAPLISDLIEASDFNDALAKANALAANEGYKVEALKKSPWSLLT